MKMRTLYLALAAAAVVTGGAAGFASAQDNDSAPPTQQADQSSYQQDYSQHWFSPSGFGPNDSQAEETRALNRAQLENPGSMPEAQPGGMNNLEPMQGDDQETTDDHGNDSTNAKPDASQPAGGTY